MKLLLTSALFLALTVNTPASAAMDPEVAYLLDYVAASGCTFTRNGEDHDAADAAAHLRMKYARAGHRVEGAEEFIEHLASASSWTGKPYTVTCAGNLSNSGDWLTQALTRHRSDAQAGAATGARE